MRTSSIFPRYLTFLIVASVCTGCSEDEANRSGLPATVTLLPPSEQDTELPCRVAEWVLTPDLRIGNSDDMAWTRVRQLLPDEDGGLRFFDSEELIVLGPSGRVRSRSGGSGQGPGEFMTPTHLGWWKGGDSIWVQDAALRRITILTADGEYVRDFRQEESSYTATYRVTQVDHFLPDGSSVAQAETQFGVEQQDSFPVVHKRGDGTMVEVVRVAEPGNYARIHDEEWGVFRHPLPSGPLVAFEPGGERVFVVERPTYDGRGLPRVRIQARSPGGTLMWTRDVPYDPVRVPNRTLDSLSVSLRQMFADIFDDRPGREVDGIFDRSVELPNHYPPIRSAFSEYGGRLWVQWADGRGDSEFTVLDADGSIIARVVGAGPNGTPQAVAGDFAWGVLTDALDIPVLIRWTIDRR